MFIIGQNGRKSHENKFVISRDYSVVTFSRREREKMKCREEGEERSEDLVNVERKEEVGGSSRRTNRPQNPADRPHHRPHPGAAR